MRYSLLLLILLIANCSDDHIIQRAAGDYFPLREGSWWQYADQSDTVSVEVEPPETLLQVECFPVSYNGTVKYLAKHDGSISQFIMRTYNFAGTDYTLLEDFIIRIELPLVEGNAYEHVLYDSIVVSGMVVKARYEVHGEVIDFAHDTAYGDIYEVSITTIETIVEPDSTRTDTAETTEFYADGVGMVRFADSTSTYELVDHYIP